MKIAIDIDGVLADQVGAALRVIEKEYGLKYLTSDVNRAGWTFSGKREIRSEIIRLLADPEYTLSVPLIEGSQKGIGQLSDLGDHDLCVVTARLPSAEYATKQWLSIHFPCLTEYYYAARKMKHNVFSDVLIDDLDMNIVEFVKSDPDRRGILFVQPWSLNGTDIENYSNQVHYCPEWKSVVRAIHDIDGTKHDA